MKQLMTLILLLLLITSGANGVNKQYEGIFKKYDVEGTIVLKNIVTKESFVHNNARSEQQFVPASTFKVLNSMIALQEGVVNDENDTIKWDGVVRGFEPWNHDQTMRSAMPISCVWFYQELARRVGVVKMQSWLDACDYGNRKIENDVDKFWLEGNLKISAKEQVAFLEKLINNQLSFDKSIQETVKNIMISDSTENYVVHSKTGWSQEIGWNVGYIETSKGIWVFAMNIDMKDIAMAKIRTLITYDVLKEEGILGK